MRLASGQRVQVLLKDGSAIRGVLRETSADSLIVVDAASRLIEAMRDRVFRIEQLESRRGRKALTGALVGTGSGIGLELVLFHMILGADGFPDPVTAMFAAVGLAAGAIAGTMVGGERHILVYQAPDAQHVERDDDD